MCAGPNQTWKEGEKKEKKLERIFVSRTSGGAIIGTFYLLSTGSLLLIVSLPNLCSGAGPNDHYDPVSLHYDLTIKDE